MSDSPTQLTIADDEEGQHPRQNDMSRKFIEECAAEKGRLGNDFPLTAMLIDEAIDRVQATGRIPGREMHADVFKQKLIKVTQKVFVPTKQFPNFNFNGKLLGPKGNSLRNLQNETLCRILIKGRNSMRDSEKEEELRQTGDPRHAHLNKDLYYEIQTIAPPAEAHARVAYALAEIRKYLIPDSNDEVSQNQRQEILADPELAKKAGKYGERAVGKQQFSGKAFNRPGVSILKKLSGSTERSNYEEPEDEEERNHLNAKQSPFHQGSNNNDRNGFQAETKPIRSILKKSIDVNEEEEFAGSQTMSPRQPFKRQLKQTSPNQGKFVPSEKRSRGNPFVTPSKTSKFAFSQK